MQQGPVDQLVRTPACHAGGREFEPHPGRHVGASYACSDFSLSDFFTGTTVSGFLVHNKFETYGYLIVRKILKFADI